MRFYLFYIFLSFYFFFATPLPFVLLHEAINGGRESGINWSTEYGLFLNPSPSGIVIVLLDVVVVDWVNLAGLTLKPGPNAFNEIGTLILANKVENSALPLCAFVGLKTSFLPSKPCNAWSISSFFF